MKHLILILCALTCITPKNHADNKNLQLHYNRPADYFEETLVIGNGTLGATIYGGTQQEKIQLNDITLWTGEPEKDITSPDAHKYIPAIRKRLFAEDYRGVNDDLRQVQGHYSQNYQPLGELLIDYDQPQTVGNYKRWLDISNATAHNQYQRNGKHFQTDYFASAPDSAIIVRLQSETPINARIHFTSPLPTETTAQGNTITIDGYAAYHSYPNYYIPNGKSHYYDPNRGIHFRTIIHIITQDGKTQTLPNGQIQLQNTQEALLLIVNATSFNGFDKDPAKEGKPYKHLANKRLNRLTRKSYNTLLKAHIKDYTTYFDRVSLDLGQTAADISALPTDQQLLRYTETNEQNPDLEELYFQFGRYLLIACSRTPGVPANLQGLWNNKTLPPWSSNYTTNINLEENYWAAELTNLSEMHNPLMDFIAAISKTGEQSAKAYYGVQNGWCMGHNSDIWAMTNPVGLHTGGITWANWTMGGAWVATHIWERYMFTKDTKFLQQHYPYLRGAAQFCLEWLVEKDGHLLTAPATSPENSYITPDGYHGAALYGGFADIAMVRECMTDAILAAKELNQDHQLTAKMEQALSRLLPYRIGKEGNLQEWYHDWKDSDPRHRHQSHLFGLYPGHHITIHTTPELAQAAARTLQIKGNETTGWSAGWRVNLFARLRDHTHAYGIFKKLLRYVSPDEYKGKDAKRGGGTYPNLLDAHAPFQIDGNFGGCAGIAEMLIQSTMTEIHILPALPQQWQEGSVSGLCARGGFVVDITWKEGKATQISITSRKGGTTTIHYNGTTQTLTMKANKRKTITCAR